MLSTTEDKTQTSGTRRKTRISPFRKPVLVYNSRTDSLHRKTNVETKVLDNTDLSEEWMHFINNLNTRMLDKISF